ncbi:unnamed protein product, partial [Oncorhynchus mykiss]
LVMAHINSILPDTLDPLQFAYHPNRSTDASIALHIALCHLDKRNPYVRMLFIDYLSAFNTIVPTKFISKDPGTKHLPLQLDPGLPDRPPPGGKGRQQQVCHADPQHWGPSGVYLVSSCTPCSPTTAWPNTTPTSPLSLLTTQW